MQVESSIRPKKIYEIENHINNKVDVVFFCNIKEIKNDESLTYKYDTYRITISWRNDIDEEIEKNYDNWLDFAKDVEYENFASKIREKRNKLLEKTDKEMCLDRLNIQFPSELTATNLLSNIKQFLKVFSDAFNGDMAKYRQELRDITKQKGFPYEVEFPKEPNTTDKSEE